MCSSVLARFAITGFNLPFCITDTGFDGVSVEAQALRDRAILPYIPQSNKVNLQEPSFMEGLLHLV